MTLTIDRLRALLSYSAETGHFHWIYGPRKGSRAGSVDKTAGYEQICIDQTLYRSHRLAWLYVNGEFPAGQIDHINGRRSDNRIENLRDASHQINNQNRRKANKCNATGLLGAHWVERCKKFSSSITKDRRTIHIGYFDTAEAAHQAHIAARRQMLAGNTL